MKTTEEQNEAGIVTSVCILLALITLLWLVLMPTQQAHADESLVYHAPRTFDVVRAPQDVPENTCRYVSNPGYPVDRVVYPAPILACDTFGVVGVVDHK